MSTEKTADDSNADDHNNHAASDERAADDNNTDESKQNATKGGKSSAKGAQKKKHVRLVTGGNAVQTPAAAATVAAGGGSSKAAGDSTAANSKARSDQQKQLAKRNRSMTGDKQALMRQSMERGLTIMPHLRDYKNKIVQNSYRTQPRERFLTEVVRRKIDEILHANFSKYNVDPTKADDGHEDSIQPFALDADYKPSMKNLVYRITEQISDALVSMPNIDGYKLFISVNIAERNGQEQIVCSRHLWDKETDRVARVTYLRSKWYCCASVFALYQY